ncbi:hypothetical protein [Massilia sp. 9096]|uniref:hypothetical protein n=1 Tax=Massilia sp. 9096 TaxID=1500894 RepID=UPI0012DFEB12|nr:hypothetical protein [Massilia sp. 9096]
MSRLLCQVVLASLAATLAGPASAALRLSVTAATRSQVNPGAKGMPERTVDSEVLLGDTYLSRREGNITVVYDFERRRRYVLDEAAKTFDEYSLFDTLGFRELELRNRAALRKTIAATTPERKLPSELEDQHELSVQGAEAYPVEVRTEGADEVFASGDAILLRHGKEATPVSPADAARFVQYLRYTFSGYPAVLAALQKEQAIPARITYTFQPGWGTGTVELKIGAPRQADAPATFTLAGYAPRQPAGDAVTLDDMIERAWAMRSALATRAVRPNAETLAASLREQRPLDAFLTVTEYRVGGVAMPPLPDEQKQALQTDPDLRQLSTALAAKTPEELRQAVTTLQGLRAQAAPARRYLLSLFEANDHVMLREAPAAAALYLDVLRANPALAGAYKDIGDFYFLRLDTQRAWRSWTIARALAPLWPTLDSITARERTLATRFPEYFELAPSAQKAP